MSEIIVYIGNTAMGLAVLTLLFVIGWLCMPSQKEVEEVNEVGKNLLLSFYKFLMAALWTIVAIHICQKVGSILLGLPPGGESESERDRLLALLVLPLFTFAAVLYFHRRKHRE